VQTESVREPIPYTRSIAGEAGWQWRIPLQHRVGNGIVFSSRYMSDDLAKQTLLGSIEGKALVEPRVIRFQPGQRLKCWSKNCIALGLASGFIEPLESTNIHVIQRGLMRLLQSFPQVITQTDIDEYNFQTNFEIKHIRDFVVMHFKLTDRQDTPYWRACRSMEITASLKHRIELFRDTGRVFRIPSELFAENSWIQVMLGQGIEPRQHHPVADIMDDDDLSKFLDEIKRSVDQSLGQLPTHQAYLERYCRSQ
jgi:tryptophan halogenase